MLYLGTSMNEVSVIFGFFDTLPCYVLIHANSLPFAGINGTLLSPSIADVLYGSPLIKSSVNRRRAEPRRPRQDHRDDRRQQGHRLGGAQGDAAPRLPRHPG